MTTRDDDFTQWVEARSSWLRRAAFLMCGDRTQAEDLAQTTLVKLYVAWPRIERAGAIDAYARRTLARVVIDESRRPWRRERPVADHAIDPMEPSEPGRQLDDRTELLAALRALPDRQRVAVVLRHWEGMSVVETAEAMSCTVSAVKTHTARGVARLRDCLGPVALTNGDAT